jgi:hypothetical protein
MITNIAQLVDVNLGEFVNADLQRAHGLRPEPVRADRADLAVLWIVHVNQRAHVGLGLQILVLGTHQDRARTIDEKPVGTLDRRDVGVLGDRPGRPHPSATSSGTVWIKLQ